MKDLIKSFTGHTLIFTGMLLLMLGVCVESARLEWQTVLINILLIAIGFAVICLGIHIQPDKPYKTKRERRREEAEQLRRTKAERRAKAEANMADMNVFATYYGKAGGE